ncbi:MAG: gpW family head-tail joining protein [Pseudomonadota bacterium]
MIGTRSVQVRIDGRMVVYSEAKLGQLRAYIRSLERQLGARRGGGAIGVDFR